jgi:hypothetical protein
MRVYRVEPAGEAWRVVCADRAVLTRGCERSARRSAAVLNEWALVEMALQLDTFEVDGPPTRVSWRTQAIGA